MYFFSEWDMHEAAETTRKRRTSEIIKKGDIFCVKIIQYFLNKILSVVIAQKRTKLLPLRNSIN